MEPIQKQTEEMIAALAGSTLQPNKITELAANFLQAINSPATRPEAIGSSDQVSAQAKEQE